MASDAMSELYERQVRRLAVMLGQIRIMGDLEVTSILTPASVDAEADEYESATHVLHDRWQSYVGPAREVLAILHAPETSAEERAAHVRAMEAQLRAEGERKRD